jgi:acyl-CoA synthetase (AMP-forming)/AMP-acid ligase II
MLGGLLDAAVEEHAERPALLWGERAVTYGELGAAVERLAGELSRTIGGSPAGERVAVIASNVPALAVATFAAWRLGAVAVPLSARLRERELQGILADAQPVAIVAVPTHGGYSFSDFLGRSAAGLPALRSCLFVAPTGELQTELACTAAERAQPLAAEFGAVLYTSGTTGAPRGALVRHVRETAAAPRLAALLGLGPADRVVLVVPMSHAYGLTCFLAGVTAGAAAVLVDATFSPGPLLAALKRSGATILHGSPSLFTSLLKARPQAVGMLRGGFVAGAPSSPQLLEELDDRGLRILNLYGLTETGAVSACRSDDSALQRLTTVGRPMPGFELRVADDGVLELRGPYVSPGYLGLAARDSDAFVDGWFRTGDLATLDDGYLRIVGRAKEIVHVGGFNVIPAEVEALLLEHPDVVQAAVVGRPDDRMGESLAAFVVARRGSVLAASDLLRFARPRIAGYKVPYALSIVPELPLLASGKPDRMALARRARTASRPGGA